MLEHITLFEPEITITKDLDLLIESLNQKNIKYNIENNIIYFEAIPYEYYISCAILISFNENVINKVHINANFKQFNNADKENISNHFLEILTHNIGKSSTNYISSEENMIVDRWYSDKLFLQLKRDINFNNLNVTFILSELVYKNKKIRKENIIFSSLISLILSSILLILNVAFGDKSQMFINFILAFIVLFLINTFIQFLINKFYKPLDLKDEKVFLSLKEKLSLIEGNHISYFGNVEFNNVPNKYLSMIVFYNNEALVYFIKGKNTLIRTFTNKDIKEVLLYDESIIVNLTNGSNFIIYPDKMIFASSILADFNYLIRKSLE